MFICEKLSILALDEDSGRPVNFAPSKYLDYLLSAAIIEDLVELKRIKIEDAKAKVIDLTDVNSPVLTEALYIIMRARLACPVEYWITNLDQSFGNIALCIYENLRDEEILTIDMRKKSRKKTLSGYKLIDAKLKRDLIAESETVIQNLGNGNQLEKKYAQLLFSMFQHSMDFPVNLPFPRIEDDILNNPIYRKLLEIGQLVDGEAIFTMTN
jgi:hypothetical protein